KSRWCGAHPAARRAAIRTAAKEKEKAALRMAVSNCHTARPYSSSGWPAASEIARKAATAESAPGQPGSGAVAEHPDEVSKPAGRHENGRKNGKSGRARHDALLSNRLSRVRRK